MPKWTESKLKVLGYHDLMALWKAHCIQTKEPSEYPAVNLEKGLLKSSLKLVEVMEVSAARALVKKRLSAIKKARIVVVKQIGQGGEKYQQSKESRRRDHLKRRLKRSSGADYLFDDSVDSISDLVEQIRSISTDGFDWEKLSKQFIDAYNIKNIDKMTDVQTGIFADNCLRFAQMIDFRGIACLHDENVYYALTVGAWFKVLIALSLVDVEEDSDCHVKPNWSENFRPNVASTTGIIDKDLKTTIILEVCASMLNGNAIAENDFLLFGPSYHAAHTCENRYCLKPEHIQRRKAQQNAVENHRMGKTSR